MWACSDSSCLRLCTFWTCMSIFFTGLGEFSFIIFSNRFSILWSLLSYDTSMIRMLAHLKLSRGSLHCPFFLKFLFLFAVPIRCFLHPYVPNCWTDFQLHLICCWFHVNYSSYQLVYPSFLTGSFLWYPCPFLCCWSSH